MDKHPFQELFNDYQSEKSDSLSIKEAADALNLSEPTVYTYLREGHLESVDSHLAEHLRVKKKSVEKLLSQKQTEKGISLYAFAKRMNITRVRLQQIIDVHNIEISKISHGRREQYLLTEDIQQRIHDILLQDGHFPKTHFYNSQRNIALFQAFTSNSNHSIYRIERIENTWGVRTPTGILPFDLAEQRFELVPNYSIRQRVRTTSAVVTICVSLQHEHFYSVIDTVYATFGMDNLQFQYDDDNLLIYVKATKYQLQTQREQIYYLEQFIINGELTFTSDNQSIVLKSFDSIFNITVPQSLLPTLEQEAKKAKLTSSQLLNRVLEEYLQQKQKESDNNECK